MIRNPKNTRQAEEVRRAWVAFARSLRGKDMQATPEEFITTRYPNLLTQVGRAEFALIINLLTCTETEAEIQQDDQRDGSGLRIKTYIVDKEGRLR